jgi:hypothetical protein
VSGLVKVKQCASMGIFRKAESSVLKVEESPYVQRHR